MATSTFTLELLHAADQEANIAALNDAPRFSAVLNALKAQDLGSDGLTDNTLVLSSGDAYIPGIFYSASTPAYGAEGRADILIQNELGFQAIAFGNHEFDSGTARVKDLIGGNGTTFLGTNFPYLSSNLNFAPNADLASLVVPDDQAPLPRSIAATTVIDVNGEKIGVVGATTPTLPVISSPGTVGVSPQPFAGNPTPDQLDALAAEIQLDVDQLLAANPDINKVVLLAHMQQIAIEQELATRLKNVDIIVAGGSNTRLFDADDRIRAGDSNQGVYPIVKTDADGKPVAVVNTDGNYKYVGRLVIDFDANGNIIPESYDPTVSGAYATDDQGVADLGAAGLVDPEIQAIVDTLEAVIQAQDGTFFGVTDEFLNGSRPDIRLQETNLGNLTADANLAIAQQYDPTVVISIKNGGGIRASIGDIVTPPGAVTPERVPPAGNELTGRPEGGISQVAIQNALAFNNGLSLVTLKATELEAIFEHAVGSAAPGVTQEGRFPQIAGVQFSFDKDLPVGNRVQSLVVLDENGNDADVIIQNGNVVGDPNRTFRIVTLDFLAGGGDGYPFPTFAATSNRVDLEQVVSAPRTGSAVFEADGSEQDALSEYLAASFSATNPFTQADVSQALDERIQNLDFRPDSVIDPTGGSSRDTLTGTDGRDRITGGVGGDILTGGAAADTFVYKSIRDAGDRITDFEVGLDQIDLSVLLDSLGYAGTDAFADGYVRTVGLSAGTVGLEIDRNGGGDSFRSFITVQGADLTAATLSAPGNFVF